MGLLRDAVARHHQATRDYIPEPSPHQQEPQPTLTETAAVAESVRVVKATVPQRGLFRWLVGGLARTLLVIVIVALYGIGLTVDAASKLLAPPAAAPRAAAEARHRIQVTCKCPQDDGRTMTVDARVDKGKPPPEGLSDPKDLGLAASDSKPNDDAPGAAEAIPGTVPQTVGIPGEAPGPVPTAPIPVAAAPTGLAGIATEVAAGFASGGVTGGAAGLVQGLYATVPTLSQLEETSPIPRVLETTPASTLLVQVLTTLGGQVVQGMTLFAMFQGAVKSGIFRRSQP